MKTENKILKHLIDTKEAMTIRGLSQKIKSDYKIVHTAVNRLIEKGLLSSKRIGRSIQVVFTNRLTKEVFEAEFDRKEKRLLNKNLNLMLESIKRDLDTVNFVLLLFGSYAKKQETKSSDIDLMFIVFDNKIENKIEEIISVLPLKIHALVFSESQFMNMKNSQELNVVKEAIKSNVILHGTEQYYELLKK